MPFTQVWHAPYPLPCVRQALLSGENWKHIAWVAPVDGTAGAESKPAAEA